MSNGVVKALCTLTDCLKKYGWLRVLFALVVLLILLAVPVIVALLLLER